MNINANVLMSTMTLFCHKTSVKSIQNRPCLFRPTQFSPKNSRDDSILNDRLFEGSRIKYWGPEGATAFQRLRAIAATLSSAVR